MICGSGIDKPLTRIEDFKRFTGHEARIELDTPIESGQKKFRGILQGIKENMISIQCDPDLFTLSFEHIKASSLILTDALIEFTKQNKTTANTIET